MEKEIMKDLEGELILHRGVGQPTKYRPEMCELLIEAGKNGMFVTEVCAQLELSTRTFYNYIKIHEDFSEAHELYSTYFLAFYERQLREGKMSFNHLAMILNNKSNGAYTRNPNGPTTTEIKIGQLNIADPKSLNSRELDKKILEFEKQIAKLQKQDSYDGPESDTA